MAFTEADNLAITRTELDEVFFQNLEMRDSFPGTATAENGKLFRVVNTTHSAYIGEINKSSGLWSQIGETQDVPQATPRVANKYTIQVSDFGNAINISKDLFDDNMHDVWSEDVKRFAIYARVTQDTNAFQIFRGAFTTTLTADGVPFISASHVTLSGAIVSNLISGALTGATLNLGIVSLGQMVTQEGVVVGAVGADMILLVAMAGFKNAIQITDSVLISDSTNNAVNIYRSMFGIEVMTSPYLGAAVPGGSDTAWFLLSPMHAVRRLIRQGVETALTSWEYSKNRTYYYQGNFRETYFVSDYFGAVGSTGV